MSFKCDNACKINLRFSKSYLRSGKSYNYYCLYHKQSIFSYLNYPELNDIFESCSLEHYKLIQIFEKKYKYNIKSIHNEMNYFFIKINNPHRFTKYAYIILLLLFIDKKIEISIRKLDSKFNLVCQEKLNEFLNLIENKKHIPNYDLIYEFLIKTFEKNKFFLTIKKNKQYRYKIFRLQMLTVSAIWKLYIDTMHKRYAPLGIGYCEARNEFENMI